MPLSTIASNQIKNDTIVDADINSSSNIATTKLGTGAVIQVVHASELSSTVSTTSGSYVDTGLSVSITPSSTSNKILILSTSVVLNNTNNCGVELRVLRDSTDIWTGRGGTDGLVNWIASGYGAQSCNINTIDSPSTTSAITYKLQYAEEFGGTAYVYDGATFMAMEIAG